VKITGIFQLNPKKFQVTGTLLSRISRKKPVSGAGSSKGPAISQKNIKKFFTNHSRRYKIKPD
jgi:hypothetical protein